MSAGRTKSGPAAYKAFRRINGRHTYRDAVPGGYVDYRARYRPGGKVFYFNFRLAREMGLLPLSHPEKMNPDLRRMLLETFSLQIINEYDVLNDIRIPARLIRPHAYMATRYLQLQHPDKRGLNSGDGRGLWNGFFRGRSITWDICSTGTGATCLSPATAIHKCFFRTGDPSISYGCGRADLLDGICQAVMSEIFHCNSIPTERVLAIIDYGDGTSVNVRAGKNLVRPAHFFRLLKQNSHEELKGLADYYIQRQVANGIWKVPSSGSRRYRHMLRYITRDFARSAALFESEYIFCWLDWDGDNILTDGGIIDYGSVRQFGLFHHEYRYDDVEKWSTTIREQRYKARYIIQTFAQLTEFVISGKKRRLSDFRRHAALREFDREFEQAKDEMMLYKMGIEPSLIKPFTARPSYVGVLREFRKVFSHFEQAKSHRGKYKVQDGITWDAVFCMRDILRELPKLYLEKQVPVKPGAFMEIIKSNYASRRDVRLTLFRKRKIRHFQKLYMEIVTRCARLSGRKVPAVLRRMSNRSALINHYDRVTGDSIIHVAGKMMRGSRKLQPPVLYRMLMNFVDAQILRPEYFRKGHVPHKPIRNPKSKRLFKSMIRIVREHRQSI